MRAEPQKHWDDAMAKWKAGGEHPLARHPLAVRCDGYSGCYTVAPIRILPNYSKRYCSAHLPIKPEGESSNPTLEFLKENDLPLTKANYLAVAYRGTHRRNWTPKRKRNFHGKFDGSSPQYTLVKTQKDKWTLPAAKQSAERYVRILACCELAFQSRDSFATPLGWVSAVHGFVRANL